MPTTRIGLLYKYTIQANRTVMATVSLTMTEVMTEIAGEIKGQSTHTNKFIRRDATAMLHVMLIVRSDSE